MSDRDATEFADLRDDSVVAARVDDILERDGEALVLCGSELSLLSPVAATSVVKAAASPLTVAELADVLLDEFGPPPEGDPSIAVRGVLSSLLERGIVDVSHPNHPDSPS